MNRTPTLLWNVRKAVALSCLAGLAFLILPVGFWIHRWSFDLLAASQPSRLAEEVVIVYIDDLSHTRLNQPYDAPWDRRLTARLLNRLKEAGASVIGFDVLMLEDGKDVGADVELAAAIRSHGKVILGATLSRGDYFGLATEIQLKLPVAPLLSQAQGWGVVELEIDPDDVVRRVYAGSEDMPSLAWRMAETIGVPGVRVSGARSVERWMNHYGPDGGIASVSFFKVLDEESPLPADFFRGKAVVVGAGSKSGYTGKRRDQFRNPYTWLTGRYSPGVELHAVTLLNLMRGDSLRRFSWPFELAGVVLLGVAFSIAVGAGRRFPHSWWGPAVALSLVLLAWTLQAVAGVWTPWLIGVLVQWPVAWLFRYRAPQPPDRDLQETQDFLPVDQAHSLQLVIPDHSLLQIIGRGAYGEVWRARTITGQERAVKIIRSSRFGDRRAFDREFAGLQAFEPVSRRHPGLVQILHVGRSEDQEMFYYVMELADDVGSKEKRGEYLPHTLASPSEQRRKSDPIECLQVARALCDALEFLHSQGLVHRDIKPQNIIFVNGCPKLADVGLVAGIGRGGSFVGTDGYLPPEGPGTVQADLFALGRTLYVMLTGHGAGDYPVGLGQSYPTEAQIVGTRLETVVRQACRSDANARYVSASAMKAALADL